MKISILFIFLVSTLLTCTQAEEVHRVSVRTHSGAEKGLKVWGPTMDYLSTTIPGHRFEMIPYPQIEAQLEDARQNKFQFILTNPSTFIEVKNISGTYALVTLVNKRQNTAQTRFGSVIFTRADRDDIIHLHDLKGKHLKVVSALAFGGWQVAWREMLQNDFNPHDELRQLSFAGGNQPTVVNAVLEGEADAGVVRTDMLERLAKNGKINMTDLRILHNIETPGFPFFHSTPLYPEWPFAAMTGTDSKLITQVKQALLSMKEDLPAARTGNYHGWTDALDYSEVEKLLIELGVSQSETSNRFSTIMKASIISLTIILAFVFALRARQKRIA